MKYPAPEANPLCRCKRDPSRCFWCKHGHLVECHYPFTCLEAGCDHLEKYKLGPVQLIQAKAAARKALWDGRLAPYSTDQDGKIIVADPKSSKPKKT
jgi:hypothetical protein